MILWQLFISFLKIGMFSFGGGYAALPLIQSEVVDQYAWISLKDFTNLITISQMTPGPIAINSATFVGLKVAGLPGAIIATLGSITPAFIIVLLLAYLYQNYQQLNSLQHILVGLRPAIVALIGTAGISIIRSTLWPNRQIIFNETQWRLLFLLIIATLALAKTNWHPILIMFATGLLNILFFAIQHLLF